MQAVRRHHPERGGQRSRQRRRIVRVGPVGVAALGNGLALGAHEEDQPLAVARLLLGVVHQFEAAGERLAVEEPAVRVPQLEGFVLRQVGDPLPVVLALVPGEDCRREGQRMRCRGDGGVDGFTPTPW